jgi:hypothetical protein
VVGLGVKPQAAVLAVRGRGRHFGGDGLAERLFVRGLAR